MVDVKKPVPINRENHCIRESAKDPNCLAFSYAPEMCLTVVAVPMQLSCWWPFNPHQQASLLVDHGETEGSATCQRVLSVSLAWGLIVTYDPTWRRRLQLTVWRSQSSECDGTLWLTNHPFLLGAAANPELHRLGDGWVGECQDRCPATYAVSAAAQGVTVLPLLGSLVARYSQCSTF